MRAMLLWLLFVLVCYSGPAQAERPRTAAFVVGITRYDDADHDKLKSPAADAARIFARLGLVAELQPYSTLVMAVDGAPARPTRDGVILKGQKISAAQIESEFRSFLSKIQDGDHVVLYFGGHGRLEGSRLQFLASDFDPKDQAARAGTYNFYDIFTEIQRRISQIQQDLPRHRRADVSVVFLANMCHSGAGTKLLDNRSTKDALGLNMWEFGSLAFLPAAAPDDKSYEDVKIDSAERDSFFARHVMEVLGGIRSKVGNSKIIADDIRSYLTSTGGFHDLPVHSGFDGTIEIGDAGEILAARHYALGMSHLGMAAEAGDETDRKQPEYLRQFALEHFWRSAVADGSLSAAAGLRWAQIMAAAAAPSEHWRKELEGILKRGGLEPDEQTSARRLLGANTEAKAPDWTSPKQLAEYLKRGGSAAALIISTGGAPGPEIWKSLLTDLHVERFEEFALPLNNIPEPRAIQAAVTARILEAVGRLRARPGDSSNSAAVVNLRPRLLLAVYTGAGAREPQTGELIPFGPAAVETLGNTWDGPVVVIYTGPFGGALRERPRPKNVFLFLAGGETNSMSVSPTTSLAKWLREPADKTPWERLVHSYWVSRFSDTDFPISTDFMLALALYQGVSDLAAWERWPQYVEDVDRHFGVAFAREKWVPGRPAWIAGETPAPDYDDAVLAGRVAEEQLQESTAWLNVLAAGCVRRTDPQCDAKALRQQTSPIDALAQAVEAERAGKADQAREGYTRFLDFVSQMKVDPTRPEWQAAKTLKDGLVALAKEAKRRRDRLMNGGPPKPKVHLVSVAVENYTSPLVSRLPKARNDIGMWQDALRRLLREDKSGAGKEVQVRSALPEVDDAATRLVVHPTLQDPATAEDIRLRIENALSKAGPGGLVVFVFSGRGVEQGGRYFLAAAGVEARRASAGRLDWRPEGLLPLDTVARTAADFPDRWLLAIYDAQFAPPLFEPGRVDALLDKHLDSVRPRTGSTVGSSGDVEVLPMEDHKTLKGQVHVWAVGRVTQASTPPGCSDSGDGTSPFTRALTRALSGGVGSYRSWAAEASRSPCLSGTGIGTPARLAVQGEPALPVLATSRDEQELNDFKAQISRALPAVIAAALSKPAANTDSLAALSEAAAGMLIRQLAPESDDPAQLGAIPAWAQTIESTDRWLENLRTFTPRKGEFSTDADFGSAALDLRVRLLRTRKQDRQAIELLLREDVRPLLSRGDLLEHLIDMIEAEARSAGNDDRLVTAAPAVEKAFQTVPKFSDTLRSRWRRLTDEQRRLRPYRIMSR